MELFGKQLTKAQLRSYVGDISQVAGAVPYTYRGGKADGTEAIEVRNGSGLRFVILPGRGMDIAWAEINGKPVSFISRTGVVASEHYDPSDFLRSFTAGLLTTCGLTNVGAPNEDEAQLHGRIANLPAYDVNIHQDFEGDDYVISVSGKVRQSRVFGENLVLKRTITTKVGDNSIYIHDTVENQGFTVSPLMLLYHCNFGFPLVSEDTKLVTNCTDLKARDAAGVGHEGTSTVFQQPTADYAEQVFYRRSAEDSFAALVNEKLGLSAKLSFSSRELPWLVEWKQMGQQDYVVGIEPANCLTEGRHTAREQGILQYIAPQEEKHFHLTITLEG
jgi:hypothetical protein